MSQYFKLFAQYPSILKPNTLKKYNRLMTPKINAATLKINFQLSENCMISVRFTKLIFQILSLLFSYI